MCTLPLFRRIYFSLISAELYGKIVKFEGQRKHIFYLWANKFIPKVNLLCASTYT